MEGRERKGEREYPGQRVNWGKGRSFYKRHALSTPDGGQQVMAVVVISCCQVSERSLVEDT